MPRSAQRGRAAIHIYRPRYLSPTDPLLGPIFGYQNFTHAYFPQDHFDEIVEQDGWVIGRRGDGYVALHSERPTSWRVYNANQATDGAIKPFDLIAPGSANNVWIVEVGRRADHGSFAGFVDAVTTANIEVVRTGQEVSVRFSSPSEGTLEFASTGGFSVEGVDSPLRDHPRHSSPWAEQCAFGEAIDINEGGARLQVDAATAARRVS